MKGVIVGGGKADDDVLESQTPGTNVIKVDALGGLRPREEALGVLFRDTLVQGLQALETNTHINNGFCDFIWVSVWSAGEEAGGDSRVRLGNDAAEENGNYAIDKCAQFSHEFHLIGCQLRHDVANGGSGEAASVCADAAGRDNAL